MAEWDFVLPNWEPDTKHTTEDPDVAYIHGLPNDLMWLHILSLFFNLHVKGLGKPPMMCHPCAIYVAVTVSGDGLSQQLLISLPSMLLNIA